MANINKAAVLNPFTDLTANILNYVPRATATEFGIVAIGSGINVDALGRIYLDTQEYSDRLTAIEAQAASSLATQQTEVATAIAQVNLAQSQTITALSLEVSNLKTDLTNSITATQTDLINRADELAQDVTDITVQLTQDKAAFTQEIQDALDYLKDDASVASALRTPRKIQGVDFDGTQDINLPVFTSEIDGLVPKRVGTTTTKYLREDGTWEVPPDTPYPLLTKATAEDGTATTANTISAQVLKEAIKFHAPPVTNIAGNAGTATKLQTPRTINGVEFDGSVGITLPLASTSNSGTVQLNNTLTSTSTEQALTAAQGKVLHDSKLGKTGNAISATKLLTSRTISLTGGVTGSVSFDGSANASIATTVTGLGAANGIATLDSNGQVPSTQLPSYVDDVLEYGSVAAFPTTGVTGKIYVETTGNTTYRWGGTAYVKITSGEVASVAGKTGVVTLTKADVGLPNVDNTADSAKNVASATKLATARTINGVAFDGTANITVADNTKLPLAGGTMSGPINFNLSHTEGAFHKLIEGSTATDGGYIAVGNHGWDRGYVEIGTIDDSDAAIYARKRNINNTVIDEAVILGSDGNTSFPESVYIHNTPSGYGTCGLVKGNADAATYVGCNIDITSWYGVGIKASISGERTIVFNARNGDISNKGSFYTYGGVTASEVNTHGVRTSNFYSSTAYSFYGPDHVTSQRIKCNSILASNAWADEQYVPHLGIFARGDISSAGNITAIGSVTAYSDKRIKEDVTVIENALTKVEQLNGVTFKRKDTLDRQTGLLAQEVEAVLPEVVIRHKASEEIKAITGDDEVLAVNYGALTGLLVESVKELSDKLKAQQELIDKQAKLIENLLNGKS